MRAISSQTRDALFTTQGASDKFPGYVVYEPMTVVEITKEKACEAKDANGKCTAYGASRCKVGSPFYLPNYSRPTLINSRTGFGKAGVDVTIVNGWQLGAVKDTTDNAAVLSLAETMIGIASSSHLPDFNDQKEECKDAGLYKLELEGATMNLVPLKTY